MSSEPRRGPENKATVKASQSEKSASHKPDGAAEFEKMDEKRYQWPPPRDPNLAYKDNSRNPIHSVISALPILMLVVGLYLYYSSESRESQGLPIGAESTSLAGEYVGLSETSDRHYLWLQQGDNRRGLRVTPEQAVLLDALKRGITLSVKAAPHVPGSNTYWVWYIEQSGVVLVDDGETLVGTD